MIAVFIDSSEYRIKCWKLVCARLNASRLRRRLLLQALMQMMRRLHGKLWMRMVKSMLVMTMLLLPNPHSQSVKSSELTFPAGHASQEVAPSSPLNFPSSQARQLEAPTPLPYFPAGQDTHEDAPSELI